MSKLLSSLMQNMGVKDTARKPPVQPTFKIWHLKSTRSGRVIQTLEELKLPYELELVKDVQAYKKSGLHPLGLLPVLEEKDGEQHFRIFESGAIVQYLVSKYGSDNKLKPPSKDNKELATFSQTTADLYHHGFYYPESERIPEVAERARQGLHKIMAVLDTWLQGQGPYMLGSAFTTPDIMNATPFYWLEEMSELSAFAEKYGNVAKYVEALKSRPSYKKAYVD